MNFKTFVIGLAAAFGLPWFVAIALPYSKMAHLEPVEYDEIADGTTGVYETKRAGRIDGAKYYAANGCANCHTQLIRPTNAGSEMYRDDWAGQKGQPSAGIAESRRETNPFDFEGEDFAFTGQTRIGPDLSNVAIRAEAHAAALGITAEEWFLRHLYRPDDFFHNSVCPPMDFYFKEVDSTSATKVMPYEAKEKGKVVVPKAQAEALAGYLLSLRKDTPIPSALNPRAEKK